MLDSGLDAILVKIAAIGAPQESGVCAVLAGHQPLLVIGTTDHDSRPVTEGGAALLMCSIPVAPQCSAHCARLQLTLVWLTVSD